MTTAFQRAPIFFVFQLTLFRKWGYNAHRRKR